MPRWIDRRFLLVAAVLLLCGCFLLPSPRGIPDPLRVAVNRDYPPLSSVNDGNVEGIEVDFARMLGAELGTQIEFVPLSLDELIPALKEHRADVIMAGLSVTEARAAEVAFVEPYARVGQMALVRKSDFLKLRHPQAMNWPTSRIGVKAGSTGADFAHRVLKSAIVVEVDTIEDGIAALREGKLDYFIHDAPTVWRVAGTPMKPDPDLIGLYQPLTEEHFAWAVRTDASELRTRLSQIVDQWKANGTIMTVIERWVPVRRVAIDPKQQP